jgi:hypothetical protein
MCNWARGEKLLKKELYGIKPVVEKSTDAFQWETIIFL